MTDHIPVPPSNRRGGNETNRPAPKPEWDAVTLYRCDDCNWQKWFPERPLDCSLKIRGGCKRCETIRSFSPVGVGPTWRPLQQWPPLVWFWVGLWYCW